MMTSTRKCKRCHRQTTAPCGICSRHSMRLPNGDLVRHYSNHARANCPMQQKAG